MAVGISLIVPSLLSLFIICTLIPNVYNTNTPHKRFEYKYSFKPPYLAQKDGSVPFWEYGGNAIASSGSVRVAPSLRSQKGAIWTKNPTNFDWWEVEFVFRINGRGRVGADGLAFWYTTQRGDYNGNVFGSSDNWNGLGIFFDSFDNDNKHNNPYIMAVVNDGTKNFDHSSDGQKQQLAGCLRDFRNKPFPTKAKIEYYKNVLTLMYQNGMTADDQDYEVCFRVENVFLPRNGFFGLSAATGGLADDHDVFMFLTTSLHDQLAGGQPAGVAQNEQEKLNLEYQEYQRKLDQQKEDYRKDHPDAQKDDTFDDMFESDNTRELNQIFQGQSNILNFVRDLSRKLDEVIGRQERTLSFVSAMQAAGGVVPSGQIPPAGAAGGVPPSGFVDTIRRHEVDALMQNQNLLSTTILEIKNLVTEVRARAEQIANTQARQPTAQVQSVGYDMHAVVNEVRDGINHLKQTSATLQQRLGAGPAGASAQTMCPTQSCLSVTVFLITIVVHLVCVLGYIIYKDSKNSSSKKLY